MNVAELMTRAQDAMTVRRVFGEPFERDGTTVIPAALVAGGGGGGGGVTTGGDSGDGAGYGLFAAPVGAYTVRAGRVRWHPAVNVNVVVLAAAAVALAVIRSRSRRR
jgi:uncharacterized spore protein YtfJ